MSKTNHHIQHKHRHDDAYRKTQYQVFVHHPALRSHCQIIMPMEVGAFPNQLIPAHNLNSRCCTTCGDGAGDSDRPSIKSSQLDRIAQPAKVKGRRHRHPPSAPRPRPPLGDPERGGLSRIRPS